MSVFLITFVSSHCSDLWEQKPLLVKRHQANYNEGWFSTKEFDDILRQVPQNLLSDDRCSFMHSLRTLRIKFTLLLNYLFMQDNCNKFWNLYDKLFIQVHMNFNFCTLWLLFMSVIKVINYIPWVALYHVWTTRNAWTSFKPGFFQLLCSIIFSALCPIFCKLGCHLI